MSTAEAIPRSYLFPVWVHEIVDCHLGKALATEESTAGPSHKLVESEPGSARMLEREWLAGIQQGDWNAFTQLFHAFYNRLCIYAETFVGSPEVAEDLVEDMFTYMWEARTRLDVRGQFKPYLYTAVRNRAFKYFRSERNRARALARAAHAEYAPGMGYIAGPEEQLNASELTAIVRDTITALPDRPREAFLLSRQHGLSHVEIAQVMQIAVSTVEKHIVRAGHALREAVEDWYSG